MKNLWSCFTACLLAVSLALAVPLALTMPDDAYAAPAGGGGGKEKGTTACSDGLDNDNDGLIDCADPDCNGQSVCTTPEICNNGTDDDGDNLIDCADPDCASDPFCAPPTPEVCNDTFDNDGDGFIDCADSDCSAETYCETTEATCDDGFDNDGDGSIDCADSDCSSAPNCGPGTVPEACGNGVDDDNDGLVDCADYADCVQAVNCQLGSEGIPVQNQFNIMMNYELGMHCTGFEFAYCCVLPPYNSILAQVVKTDKASGDNWPRLLEADHTEGLDFLNRPTVLRDKALDANGNFKKYQLRYWHDAQPRNDGNGAGQATTLISEVENNSLLMWNTVAEGAVIDANGALIYGTTDGSDGVVQGNFVTPGVPDFSDANDNYWNAIWNHLYIYADLEGSNPGNSSQESDKIRLGMPNPLAAGGAGYPVIYPENTGAGLHPMGPGSTPGFDNVLTFSGDTGTVVFTQMKVLENLPVMLTSPRIWEALGLPLTPFEDTINFFNDPGSVTEQTIRPYVAMKAQLVEYPSGNAVLDDGHPVIGFGTAPIDIPNCERCHALAPGVGNSAQTGNADVDVLVQDEIDFWNFYYSTGTGSDWYSRLKGAAISILGIHDKQHGTDFLTGGDGPGGNPDYPIDPAPGLTQATRLGHGSVMCQRCHADNVIAVVKSANCGPSQNCDVNDPRNQLYSQIAPGSMLIKPLTEALHNNHKGNPFDDGQGRNGGCQGCHPAHRSDGDMSGYPITEEGLNAFSGVNADNRDAAGGCFVGRDVHSNPNRNANATTPSHLNAVGQWLQVNVASDTSPDGPDGKGIWCTNCHSQLGQELWKAENVSSLVHAQPGDPGHVRQPAALTGNADADLNVLLDNLGIDHTQGRNWLDPKTDDDMAAIWNEDPGMCAHAASLLGLAPADTYQDGNVATIEISIGSIDGSDCSTGIGLPGPDCFSTGKPSFYICGTVDGDPGGALPGLGDVNVNILDFCTTGDCVAAAQASLGFVCDPLGSGTGHCAVPVPFSAATDGRDHWLSAGEPHCADCHAAPYVEQSGNITAYPPFNYPRKASLFRYTRGHQDITCQGCHESIHGLYPVTGPEFTASGVPIDSTSYAQAASMNADGSHGPLKCAACHAVNADGVYINVDGNGQGTPLAYNGTNIDTNFDAAVSWMHTYTDEADPRDSICLRCHVDNREGVSSSNGKWTTHSRGGRVSRDTMDKVEKLTTATAGNPEGHVFGDPDFEDPEATVCVSCHGDRAKGDAGARGNTLSSKGCSTRWKNHLIEGRASEKVWEYVTANNIVGEPAADGTYCGW